MDGVRIAGASGGTAQLANILPDQIDHIEVVRGNVSALYGSDAIGGVVQIFTKSGAGQAPAANASVEYGSNNTRQGTVGYGGQVGEYLVQRHRLDVQDRRLFVDRRREMESRQPRAPGRASARTRPTTRTRTRASPAR